MSDALPEHAPALRSPLRPLPRIRPRPAVVFRVLGVLALAGLVAGCVLVAVAADQHHSFLAPSIRKSPPSWLTWPFRGVWSDLPANRFWLERLVLFILLGTLGCYLVALACARYLSVTAVWIATGIAYVVLFLGPPLLLTDLFNYIDYARMGALHHLNPYTHLPLANKGDGLVFHLSNWHNLHSPYGPLFTLGTYALAPLPLATAYWTYKAAVLAAGLGCVAMTGRLARRVGVSVPLALVLVGLNPIVLLYGQGGQHNDVFDVLFVLLALDLLLSARSALAAASMTVATALKASVATLVPPLVAAARDRRAAFLGAVAGAAVLGGATLAVFGPHLPAVRAQSKLVTLLSVPNIIGFVAGNGGEGPGLRLVMEIVLAAATVACTVWAWRSRDPIAPLGVITLVTIATLGWDMPWYLGWLLPFMALSRNRVFLVGAACMVVWVSVQWLPLMPHELHKLGFTAQATKQWHVNKSYMTGLLK